MDHIEVIMNYLGSFPKKIFYLGGGNDPTTIRSNQVPAKMSLSLCCKFGE